MGQHLRHTVYYKISKEQSAKTGLPQYSYCHYYPRPGIDPLGASGITARIREAAIFSWTEYHSGKIHVVKDPSNCIADFNKFSLLAKLFGTEIRLVAPGKQVLPFSLSQVPDEVPALTMAFMDAIAKSMTSVSPERYRSSIVHELTHVYSTTMDDNLGIVFPDESPQKTMFMLQYAL